MDEALSLLAPQDKKYGRGYYNWFQKLTLKIPSLHAGLCSGRKEMSIDKHVLACLTL